MRLIRGTGLQGLRGILPQSKFKRITFIRPLIELEKEEIIDWLKQKGLTYKVDYTNFQDKFFRNRIRHKLLPLLAEFNPQIKNVIFNLSRILSFDYDFLMFVTRDIFSKLKKQKSYKTIRLKLEELEEMHPSLILQILRLAIEEVKGDTRRLEYKHFEQILDMIREKKPSLSLDIPQLQIKKEDGWLSIGTVKYL
jgi:tRNA(Ile)-lysidine synthase